ncbi:MAG: hypothetical protein IJY10_02915 [Lachnospiraceae bacterium]|nr:hypothetical protein [Lachnospiraceae bacterium]
MLDFLRELKDFLNRKDFDIDTEFILIRKRKECEDEEYSTYFTMLDLEYDVRDVVERLKELTLAEYSETKIDKDDVNPPVLFVFGKIIDGRLVYVKLKMKGNEMRYVLCVSFHYAKSQMVFPYACQ